MSAAENDVRTQPSSSAAPETPERKLWMSIEELDGGERFEDVLRREYPSQIHKFMDPPQRREFLKLMGASLALAGASACTRQPTEKILPYAKSPEALVQGRSLQYATSMPWARGSIGLLVESHQGRPTKVEGNVDHPASLGATDAFAQASVLGLYDPDRSRTILHRGRIGTWNDLLTELKSALTAQRAKDGAGLRILTGAVDSPTLAQQLRDVLALYPKARWHSYEPIHRDNERAGARLAFGTDVALQASFGKADVVLAIESDFLQARPESVRAIRDFSARRRVRESMVAMNRLYVVESALSNTGAMADHRLALASSSISAFTFALARELGIEVAGATDARTDEHVPRWLRALAKDLAAHRGSSLVVVGDNQPREVHACVHAINHALGNVGSTLRYTEPLEHVPADHEGDVASITELVADMQAGNVDVLVALDSNPIFTAPADLQFAEALKRVALKIHMGLYEDETAYQSDWHLAQTHFLESWSDTRASDGTMSIVQPLIAPLYDGKSAHQLVAALLDQPSRSSYEIVREQWQKHLGNDDFERAWRRALHDGVLAGSAFATKSVTLRSTKELAPPSATPGLEVVFAPDPTVWDGRFANNGWLQELPKPLTRLTWDNTAQLSPTLAARLEIDNGDVVELTLDGRKLRAPAWIAAGQADDTIVVHLGYGRARAGKLGNGAGFDAFRVRGSRATNVARGARIEKTGDTYLLATTQEHERMEGRDLVRVGTIDRFRENPHMFAGEHHGAKAEENTSLYAPKNLPAEHAWAMVIDLNACTSCGACVTACQSENNVPVVGKTEVSRGREMHWVRIDRYFEGPRENPEAHFQPIPCMHCENAPCEVVCPVGATTHSPEGLNEMTYNRCVGTRYCSNNCPYKVRRFNFFRYADFETETFKMQRNPDVSVRSRGVMEKCTYCVQRINRAKIQAEKEDRRIADGEIVTACQAVCPAQAIAFGDLRDESSAVARLKREPHEYGLLEELNTRPRTTYLAKIKNPNPELSS